MPSAKNGMEVRRPGERKKGGEGKRREGGKGRPEAGAPQKINTSETATGTNGEKRQRPNTDQKGQRSGQAQEKRGNLSAEQRAERRKKSNAEGTN